MALTPIGLQFLRFTFEGRVYDNSFASIADIALNGYLVCMALLLQRGNRSRLPTAVNIVFLVVVIMGVAYITLTSTRVIGAGAVEQAAGSAATQWAQTPANLLHAAMLIVYIYGIPGTIDVVFNDLGKDTFLRAVALVCVLIWIAGFIVDWRMNNLAWPNIVDPERDIYSHIWNFILHK